MTTEVGCGSAAVMEITAFGLRMLSFLVCTLYNTRMMDSQELALPEVKLLRPRVHSDERGFLSETFRERDCQERGLPDRFAQDNLSFSKHRGTVRGLHFQNAPHIQAKLVQVMRGKIFDVAVDIRPHSPTFGQHASAILSEDDLTLMFIPEGFAHGFCTLTDNVLVAYKMTTPYAPASEGGVLWHDPDLNIPWPVDATKAILSVKDRALGRLKDLPR